MPPRVWKWDVTATLKRVTSRVNGTVPDDGDTTDEKKTAANSMDGCEDDVDEEEEEAENQVVARVTCDCSSEKRAEGIEPDSSMA